MITKNSYNKFEPVKIAGLICSFTLLIFYTFDLLLFCSFRNISAASNTINPRSATIRVTKKNLPNPVVNILPRSALRQSKKAVTKSIAARDNAINVIII